MKINKTIKGDNEFIIKFNTNNKEKNYISKNG